MSAVFDINNIVLTINGHTVEGGYSSDADAIMFDPIELVGEPDIGAAGDAVYVSTGNRGGGFTLKLLPNAPSIPYFQQQAEILRRRGTIRWDGSIRDTRRNISAQLVNGTMRMYQPFTTYGKNSAGNHEYTFYFQEIISDYEAPAADAFPVQVRAA